MILFGIPKDAQDITLNIYAMQLSGSEDLLIKIIGGGGNYIESGYESLCTSTTGSAGGSVTSTAGFAIAGNGGVFTGSLRLLRVGKQYQDTLSGPSEWIATGQFGVLAGTRYTAQLIGRVPLPSFPGGFVIRSSGVNNISLNAGVSALYHRTA